MIKNIYPYFFTLFGVLSLYFLFLNFKPYKSEYNNKILLKNLLEGFDLELPEELKKLEKSSTDK